MKYNLNIILFLIFLLHGQKALGEDQRYRIELLVVRHLDASSEPEPQMTLKDFSAALDLLTPAEEEGELGETASEVTPGNLATALQNPADEAANEALGSDHELVPAEPEPQIMLVETLSDTMQRVWRRLRLSAAFRPELYLSWEQPDHEPFPLIRIHDQELLYEDDPYADLRGSLDGDDSSASHTFSDTDTPLSGMKFGASLDDEERGIDTVTLPEPTRYYRIDGSASLRETRFLHLDLNIELREPLTDNDELAIPIFQEELQEGELPRPSSFLVHAVRQSRQVQTQDLEYFDGSVIAVLALISRIEPVVIEDSLVESIVE